MTTIFSSGVGGKSLTRSSGSVCSTSTASVPGTCADQASVIGASNICLQITRSREAASANRSSRGGSRGTTRAGLGSILDAGAGAISSLTDGSNGNECSGSNGTAYFKGVPNFIERGRTTLNGGRVSETGGDGCLDLSRGVGFGGGGHNASIG